jgi:hypothetical protein
MAIALFASVTPSFARPTVRARPANVTGIVISVNSARKSFVLQQRTGWGKRAKTRNLSVMTTGGTTYKRVGRLPLTRKAAGFGDLAAREKVQVRGLPVNAGRIGATYVLIKQPPRRKK